jgi:hypothetical protein
VDEHQPQDFADERLSIEMMPYLKRDNFSIIFGKLISHTFISLLEFSYCENKCFVICLLLEKQQ